MARPSLGPGPALARFATKASARTIRLPDAYDLAQVRSDGGPFGGSDPIETGDNASLDRPMIVQDAGSAITGAQRAGIVDGTGGASGLRGGAIRPAAAMLPGRVCETGPPG